jgi:transposase
MDKAKIQIRQRRIFSEALKKEIIRNIEKGKLSVSQTTREYSVAMSSVYRWIEKYSHNLHQGTVLVMQKKSEATQKEELLKRIKELEAALGRKQLELEVNEKIIEIASKIYGEDIKKKLEQKLSISTEKKSKSD